MLSSILGIAYLLTSSVSAFDPTKESCRPASEAYKGLQSVNYKLCTQTSKTDSSIDFACGEYGNIGYEYIKNYFAVKSKAGARANQLTIHGVCLEHGNQIAQLESGKQIAHLDIYTPALGALHIYPGMNRVCDLSKENRRVEFVAYTLNAQEIQECAKTPIKSIFG